MRLFPTLLLAVLLCIAGCAPDRHAPLAPLPPVPPGTGVAPQVSNARIGTTEPAQHALVSYGKPVAGAAAAPANPAEPGGNITLDFADTDIREVVSQILGSMLHVNYTVDPSVHGTATLHTAVPLSRGELIPTLQVLLNQNNATLVQEGSVFRVLPIAASASAAGIAEGGATAGSSVIPLRYASAEQIAKVLQPYVTSGAKVIAAPGRNALVISGEPASRETLTGLIHAFDVDWLANESLALLPASGSAKEFASALQEALGTKNGGALAGVVRVVPMDHFGAVLVAAPSESAINNVRRIYNLMARQRNQTVRSWHVYFLQNDRSNDVAYVLQQAFTPDHVTAVPTPHGLQQNSSGSNLSNGSMRAGLTGSGGGIGGGGAQGGYGGGLPGSGTGLPGSASAAPAPQPETTPGPGANPLLGALDQASGGGGANENEMRIIPNNQNNALLIYGTPHEFDTVEAMLHKIDILPLQVRIDATIAEVTLNDELRYGTQFFFRQGGLNSALAAAGAVATTTNPLVAAIPSVPNGFFLAGSNASQVALNLLQSITKVQVLSSPELLVLDNEPARLQVGDLVPYLTSQSQATFGNSAVINSVSYQQTGVILNVTPRVNSNGLVTLDIAQEVSDVDNTVNTNGITSPAFLERDVQSRVVVQDGQTIGLAGLIRDNSSRTNGGVPFLKDIPLLGALFGTQQNKRQRTELLVLITPHVVHDQRDALALTEDLRDHLINAAEVPRDLNNEGPTGSADPNRRVLRSLGLVK